MNARKKEKQSEHKRDCRNFVSTLRYCHKQSLRGALRTATTVSERTELDILASCDLSTMQRMSLIIWDNIVANK